MGGPTERGRRRPYKMEDTKHLSAPHLQVQNGHDTNNKRNKKSIIIVNNEHNQLVNLTADEILRYHNLKKIDIPSMKTVSSHKDNAVEQHKRTLPEQCYEDPIEFLLEERYDPKA